jgi:hypothetical protein
MDKYDISAIELVKQKEPCHLVRSSDGRLIMRRDAKGDFVLFAHNQKTVVEIPAKDAREFALWVLMAS